MNSETLPLGYNHGWPVKRPNAQKGMVAEVTRLRKLGKKVTMAESRATAVVCEVRWLRDMGERGMAYRIRCQLDFLDTKAISGGSAGKPLFDPCVEEWTHQGIVVSGWEIEPGANGDGSTQYYQVLLVKPVLVGV